MKKTVDAALTSTDINDITKAVEDIYGVYPDEISAEVSYITSGKLDLTLEDGVNSQDVLDKIEEAIAQQTNNHIKDVTVTIDPDTNEITYTIESDTFDKSTDNKSAVGSVSLDNIDGIVESALLPDDEIEVQIDFAIDGTNIDNATTSNDTFKDKYSEEWNVTASEDVITSSPTKMPSFMPSSSPTTFVPTTSMPSAAPSITGKFVCFLKSITYVNWLI